MSFHRNQLNDNQMCNLLQVTSTCFRLWCSFHSCHDWKVLNSLGFAFRPHSVPLCTNICPPTRKHTCIFTPTCIADGLSCCVFWPWTSRRASPGFSNTPFQSRPSSWRSPGGPEAAGPASLSAAPDSAAAPPAGSAHLHTTKNILNKHSIFTLGFSVCLDRLM